MTDTTTPTALLLCDDLLFGSKLTTTARAQSLHCKQMRTLSSFLAEVQRTVPVCVLLDLQHAELEVAQLVPTLRQLGVKQIVGYGSHVDVVSLQQARAAGCDVVWPRSKMADEFGQHLPSWLGEPQSTAQPARSVSEGEPVLPRLT